jgi:hypothetical protein
MVSKLIPRDDVSKKGSPFTNITSATNDMYLCSWIKFFGILAYSTLM